jgi:hypothetical protein
VKTQIVSCIVCVILCLTVAPAQSRTKTPAEADSSIAAPRSLDFNLINGSSVSWSNGSAGRFQMRFCIEPTFVFSNNHEKVESTEDKDSGTEALIILSAIPLFRLSSGRRIQTYAGCGPVLAFHEYYSKHDIGSNDESIRIQTFHHTEWGAGIRAVAGVRIPLPRHMALFSEYHFTVLRGWGNKNQHIGTDNINSYSHQMHSWNAKLSPLRFGLSIAI